MGTYVPNTIKEQEEMLTSIGLDSMEDLFRSIPEEVKLSQGLRLPDGLTELELRRRMTGIAGKNQVFQSIFRGCGAYRHYIPSIVKQVTSKEEFVTAYTPYQAEISQGVLQSIFEYQTMICELTGMEVSNASVYDGATAAAEAVIMCKERQRKKALVSETVHPQILETIRTYLRGTDMELLTIPALEGRTNLEALNSLLDEETACVLIQQPNYYGLLEDGDAVRELLNRDGVGAAHKDREIKYIISCNPISLGLLKTPAEYGADIAVGEGQPLGIPLSYGGPYLGFMAATGKLMRKLPGRIVGETKDAAGRRAFVLTLQAREQHIRREKASSNICSNQALCAMTAAVYLSAMGKKGLRAVAESSMSKAHYLADRLQEAGFRRVYSGEFFHEFVTASPLPVDKVLGYLQQHGILGGYPVKSEDGGEDRLIWCATEMNTREEIDELIELIKALQKEVGI